MSNFDDWCNAKSEDLYEKFDYLMSEGAMTADDIFMEVEKAFQAGRKSTVNDVIWLLSEYDVISPGIKRSDLNKIYEDLANDRKVNNE
jgi:hypothetical protein